MLEDYLPIVFLLALAGAFAVFSVIAARILSPKAPTPQKLMAYESGISELEPQPSRYPVRFYLVAMLFVIFDVEVVLLFPWAVSFRQFPQFSLIAVGVFIAILLLAYVYEWRNGGLKWD